MKHKIAIIGCGVVGASIAYELSRIPGLEITIVEQNTPASGSTGAALGVLMGVISHKTKSRAWRLRETSLKRYQTLLPELEALTGITIPVNRQGIVKLLFPGDRLDKWQQLQQTRHNQGWQLEIWDKAYLHQQCPYIDRDDIIAAVYSPQDRQIHPSRLTEALVAGAKKNGVNCQFGVKVEQFIIKSSNHSNLQTCSHLETTNGELAVDWPIVSAGLGSTPLTSSLQQSVDIRPVLGQALKFKLERNLGNEDFQPVITGDDIHIVPLGDRQYWLGATVEFPNEEGEVNAQAELLTQIKQQAIDFCPPLADAKIEKTWFGKRPRPQGQPAPIIGKLNGYSNVLLATGHYRNGVLLAPATAQAIQNLVTQ
ncbi:MAG: FAD-dependent oxidoreductase [Xenococcaceae cyanobacterium MO_188.B32]|nr:FAD-dependent oxidoreductase [Xenococcaceae cyanobacterium MO_188.B32]